MLTKRKLLASYTRSEQITVYTRKKSARELHLLLVLRGVTGCVTGRPVNNRNIRLCNRTPVKHLCETYIYIYTVYKYTFTGELEYTYCMTLGLPSFHVVTQSLHKRLIYYKRPNDSIVFNRGSVVTRAFRNGKFSDSFCTELG